MCFIQLNIFVVCVYGTNDNFNSITVQSCDSSFRQYLRSNIYKTTFKLVHSIIEYSFVVATHDKTDNSNNNEAIVVVTKIKQKVVVEQCML